jgi:hypothetical protein
MVQLRRPGSRTMRSAAASASDRFLPQLPGARPGHRVPQHSDAGRLPGDGLRDNHDLDHIDGRSVGVPSARSSLPSSTGATR